MAGVADAVLATVTVLCMCTGVEVSIDEIESEETVDVVDAGFVVIFDVKLDVGVDVKRALFEDDTVDDDALDSNHDLS
jgi:hypothetical protein